MNNAYMKWKTLCAIFQAACDDQLRAHASVTWQLAHLDDDVGGRRFAKELEKYMSASQRLAEINRKMVEFVDVNASWIPSH